MGAGEGEAERFARLMRELKERGGLSYGALARTLHTSTSTLHRYCNGEAVPVEFAVVDRFARACGASTPEAVALHRAWLLADARRRAATAPAPQRGRQLPHAGRGVGGESGSGLGPGPGPEAESERESESDAGPGSGSGAELGPDSGSEPEAELDQEPGPGSRQGSGSESGSDAEPGSELGSDAEPESDAGPGSGLGSGSGSDAGPGSELGPDSGSGSGLEPQADLDPEPGPGLETGAGSESESEPGPGVGSRVRSGFGVVGRVVPWYRRRGVVVGVGGVAAVAVVMAAWAVVGPERGAPSGGGGAVVGSSPSAPSGASAAAGSVGPSGSGAGASPAGEPVPSSGSDSASARPAAAPLKANVRSHVWAAGCDHAYLAARAPGSVPPPPVEADAAAWAATQGAVHAGTQIVEVTLHGTGPGSVVLEDLEVRVAARRTPPAWNLFQMSQGCGGSLTPATFKVDLDAPRPLARPVAGNDAGSALPAPAFPQRVSASEPVVVRVEASTHGCDCDWYLDLRWSGPAGSGTLRIDDGGGRPLRTSAATGRPAYGYATEAGRWER